MENFEQQDQEVMDMVNNANHSEHDTVEDPELMQAKAKISKLEGKLKEKEDNLRETEIRCARLSERQIRSVRFKAFMAMLIKVLLCAATSLLFSTILVRPECVEPVAHLGIVIAGAVAAVHVDRFITRY